MRLRPALAVLVGSVTIGLGGHVSALAQSSAEISVTFSSGRTDPGPYAYEPDDVRVDVGATVTWENVDELTDPDDNNAVDHPTQCIKGQAKGTCPWGTEDLPPGGTFSVTFPESGTFPYFCAVHPYMEGTIVVGSGQPPTQPTAKPTSKPTTKPEPTSAPAPGESEPSSEPEADASSRDDGPGTSESETESNEEPNPSTSTDDDATDSPVAAGSPSEEAAPGEVIVGSEDPNQGSGLLKVVAGLAVLGAGGLGLQQWRGRP